MAHPPAAGPIGFLSDLHGNLAALNVVLAELERLEVKRLFVAGDLLLGGEEPLEVWQRLQALGATCTRGPSDMALATVDPQSLVPIDDEQRRQARAFSRTRAAIGDLVAERLDQSQQLEELIVGLIGKSRHPIGAVLGVLDLEPDAVGQLVAFPVAEPEALAAETEL